MRPQAPAYLLIPYTNYPALACYWVRRPQYVRENKIQGQYRGTKEHTPRFSVHTVHTPQGLVRYFGMYRVPKLTSVRYQIPRTEPGTEPSVHTSAAIPTLSGTHGEAHGSSSRQHHDTQLQYQYQYQLVTSQSTAGQSYCTEGDVRSLAREEQTEYSLQLEIGADWVVSLSTQILELMLPCWYSVSTITLLIIISINNNLKIILVLIIYILIIFNNA